MKKIIIIFSLIFVSLYFSLALRPISVDRNNCETIKGTVTEVKEGGAKDLVIKVSGQDRILYINRGLEKKFNLPEFREKFIGKKVTVSFADHWTPLDPFSKGSRHITELTIGKEIVYSEFKEHNAGI